MEYAARLTRIPSRKTLVAPLVALVVGAGVATGAYALIDNGDATSSEVIVVERPGPHAAEIPGKNESATAAAISQTGSHATGLPRPDEATVAAAISKQSGPQATEIPGKDEAATAAAIGAQQGVGINLRGSKASDTGTSTSDRGQELRSDPHGAAISLRNP
jgi:hypothetical protein